MLSITYLAHIVQPIFNKAVVKSIKWYFAIEKKIQFLSFFLSFFFLYFSPFLSFLPSFSSPSLCTVYYVRNCLHNSNTLHPQSALEVSTFMMIGNRTASEALIFYSPAVKSTECLHVSIV